MQSSGEGQAPFSRLNRHKDSGSRELTQTAPGGLMLSVEHVAALKQLQQQQGAVPPTACPLPLDQTNVASAPGLGAWNSGQIPYPHSFSVSNSAAMISTTQHPVSYSQTHSAAFPSIALRGDMHYCTGVDHEDASQISYGAQYPHFLQGVSNAMPCQPTQGLMSHRYETAHQGISVYSGLGYRANHNHPDVSTCNTYAETTAAPNLQTDPNRATMEAATRNFLQTHPSRATMEAAARNFDYSRQPIYGMLDHDVPVSTPHPSNEEVIDVNTPPKNNAQLIPEPGFRFGTADAKVKGSQPTQLDLVDTTSSDWSPLKSNVASSRKDVRDTRNLVTSKKPRRFPSPSIDVDNEDNNECRGRNRPVPEDTIDLSKESNEENGSKLKKAKGRKSVEPREKQYRIPSKTDKRNQNEACGVMNSGQLHGNEGTNPTSFEDAHRQAHREPRGPPPRAFQGQSDENAVRRSPRLTTKSIRVTAGTSPTNSGDRAKPGSSPMDGSIPIGGIPKENREKNSKGNSSMYRNRSSGKRRRSNRINETNSLLGGSDDLRNTEKRKPCDKRRTTRKTKRDGRSKTRKGKSCVDAKRAPVEEKLVNDDSDNCFPNVMRQRITLELGGKDVRKEHQQESPLSNTVGDGSDSDDDDDDDVICAGGNELSSDDDAPPPPKQSARRPRKRCANASKRTQAVSESLQASRTPGKRYGMPTRVDTLSDSEDDPFVKSPGTCITTGQKEDTRRTPTRRKTKGASITLSSPVDLTSPASSRPQREPVRRSLRNAKKDVPEQQTDDVSTDDSDEDFVDSCMKIRARIKTGKAVGSGSIVTHGAWKRPNPARKQENSESNSKRKKIESTTVESGTSEGESASSDDSQGDEDSDAGEITSQEQGSQPIHLKVKVVKTRKKPNPKVFPERDFKKLTPDELAIIRVAFIKRYPAPPSNMQAQGRYEAAHGTAMSAGMVQRTWEIQLKPWSDRWWKFYLDFNQKVRQRKLEKPRNKDPKIKEKEVKAWVEDYYREHGDARSTPQDTTPKEDQNEVSKTLASADA